jgi:hypothetical protein
VSKRPLDVYIGLEAVWNFLNENAGAIQAIGSVVTAVVTAILVVVTRRYVHLTERLATAAAAQLEFQKEAEVGKTHELNAYVKLIAAILASLPNDQQTADRVMRHAINWSPDDLLRFQALASQLSLEAGEHAATMATSMSWLAERVQDVKNTPPSAGYNWSRFPWAQWIDHLGQANAALEQVRRIVVARFNKDSPA